MTFEVQICYADGTGCIQAQTIKTYQTVCIDLTIFFVVVYIDNLPVCNYLAVHQVLLLIGFQSEKGQMRECHGHVCVSDPFCDLPTICQ